MWCAGTGLGNVEYVAWGDKRQTVSPQADNQKEEEDEDEKAAAGGSMRPQRDTVVCPLESKICRPTTNLS